MILPSIWRYLQTKDARLFAAFEEFYNWVYGQQKPFLLVSAMQGGTGSSYRALPVFNDKVIDRANEFDTQFNTWNPSRLGVYRLTANVMLNGPTIGAGDAFGIGLWLLTSAGFATLHELSLQKAHTNDFSTAHCSAMFRVTELGKQYKVGVWCTSTIAPSFLGASTVYRDRTSFSAEYIGEFN